MSTADHVPGCFLCVKPGEDRDAANLIVLRGTAVYAILNLFPYNTGHTLIAPYAHGADFAALPTGTATELTAMTQLMVGALAKEYTPEGFNVGLNLGRVAGAGVPDHLHVHVVPRWAGDTNFMTVTGETKVLPETLERTYARVTERLGAARSA